MACQARRAPPEARPRPEQAGSLLELTGGGKTPIALPGGETRTFLADGDELALRGYCDGGSHRRIGFGACVGRIHPSLQNLP